MLCGFGLWEGLSPEPLFLHCGGEIHHRRERRPADAFTQNPRLELSVELAACAFIAAIGRGEQTGDIPHRDLRRLNDRGRRCRHKRPSQTHACSRSKRCASIPGKGGTGKDIRIPTLLTGPAAWRARPRTGRGESRSCLRDRRIRTDVRCSSSTRSPRSTASSTWSHHRP